MKKPYQIAGGCAVQRMRPWAEDKSPVVQRMLPMVEFLTLAKQGDGELIREAGFAVDLIGNGFGNRGFQGHS